MKKRKIDGPKYNGSSVKFNRDKEPQKSKTAFSRMMARLKKEISLIREDFFESSNSMKRVYDGWDFYCDPLIRTNEETGK